MHRPLGQRGRWHYPKVINVCEEFAIDEQYDVGPTCNRSTPSFCVANGYEG